MSLGGQVAAFDPKRTVASFETKRPASRRDLRILSDQEVNLTPLFAVVR